MATESTQTSSTKPWMCMNFIAYYRWLWIDIPGLLGEATGMHSPSLNVVFVTNSFSLPTALRPLMAFFVAKSRKLDSHPIEGNLRRSLNTYRSLVHSIKESGHELHLKAHFLPWFDRSVGRGVSKTSMETPTAMIGWHLCKWKKYCMWKFVLLQRLRWTYLGECWL